MKHWIRFPLKKGTCSKQAHADLPKEGFYERELGRHGFFGPATHMHHQHPPTGWDKWEGDLKPRAYDLNKVYADLPSPWDAPIILNNKSCKVRLWRCTDAMSHCVRNADGDDCLFIHQGQADFYCDYGHMTIEAGHYVIIPRGTLWRVEPSEPLFVLMIEASNEAFQLPDKGLVGDHAIFDRSVLETPDINDAFKAQYSEDTTQIKIKRFDQVSTVTFPFNPLDAIGWHGEVSVVKLHWQDIRPLMSHRYHLPPSAHTTFIAPRFVICTFVPRPIESDPGALKVPFYHNNDDFDEVIFYHAGDFFSRDNIKPGMMSFHPAGFTHGPHPKAFEAGLRHLKKETNEVAVMIDTRDALHATDVTDSVEWQDYVNSWKSK